MKRLALIALAGALAPPSLAHAQRLAPMKAAAFGKMCSTASTRTACDAYLSGLTDGVTLAQINGHNNGDAAAPTGFCVPANEDIAAMRTKVLTWLKAHTDSLGKPVGESVFTALHDSYPCDVKK
ncbi:MAG: Rap1a/Tai family immunity protein [Acetobacter sp.]